MLNLLRLWSGRNAMLVASILGLLGMIVTWDRGRLEAVRKDEQTQQLKRGIDLNAKGLAAHERADVPGAVDRLRHKYCRDC